MADKISFKEFNNKSRKGTYIYIKSKGKKGSYYKWNVTDNVEGIVKYYDDKVKKGSLKEYKQQFQEVLQNKRGKKTKLRQYAQRYKYKKHLGKKLDNVMEKGIGYGYITDVHMATQQDINKGKMDMLRQIVLDPEVRQLVATDENLQKLQHRIQGTMKVFGEKNILLDNIKVFQKMPDYMVNEIKEYLYKGLEVTDTSPSLYRNILYNRRLNSNIQKRGLIQRIDLELIFRKN